MHAKVFALAARYQVPGLRCYPHAFVGPSSDDLVQFSAMANALGVVYNNSPQENHELRKEAVEALPFLEGFESDFVHKKTERGFQGNPESMLRLTSVVARACVVERQLCVLDVAASGRAGHSRGRVSVARLHRRRNSSSSQLA